MKAKKVCKCSNQYRCSCGYHAVGRVKGKDESVSINKWLAARNDARDASQQRDAQSIADDIEKWIRDGKPAASVVQVDVPKAAAKASTADDERTVAALHKAFVGMLKKRVSRKTGRPIETWANQDGMLNKIGAVVVEGKPFAAFAVEEVEETHLECVFEEVTEERAEGTKRKYRQLFLRASKFSARKFGVRFPIDEDTLDETFPAGADAMRTQRVPRDVEANLIEAATEGRKDGASRLAGMIIAAIETGGRRGELLALQWRDILFDADNGEGLDPGQVNFAAREKGARKSGKGRKVLLTPRLRSVLESLRIDPAGHEYKPLDYVFGDDDGTKVKRITKAWNTAVLRAFNIEPEWTKSGGSLTEKSREALRSIDLHFHDLRHECALRWCFEAKLELNVIAELLGHRDLAMLRIYLGLTTEDAVARHAAKVAGTVPEATTIRTRKGEVCILNPAPDITPATSKRVFTAKGREKVENSRPLTFPARKVR